MKTILATAVALAFCTVAFAAGTGKGPGGGAYTPVSVTVDAKTDPVLSRLALTDEQLKTIDKINTEAESKKAEFLKTDPKPKGKEIGDKCKEIRAETLKKIREVLTADQQTKFDAGQTLVTDFDAKKKAAADERSTAVKAAGADKDKKDAAIKAYDEKVAALKADLEKALDEKVGKVGATPAAKN
jgi:Spy/CpxP family protein refolding chaperone